ncbi:hypothetical protein REPUB_Repub04eG0054400 [Reevesia pubescens]
MPNGSLGEVLHRKKDGHLHWDTRYKIAVEAAKGLCYLHHDCSPLIVHRDVKSNNILLDSDFEAHVADFGLAKFLQDFGTSECMSTIAGSYGYIAPGSTHLHLAARRGSLDCIRKLLAWGADRLQRYAFGRIPYVVAVKHKHGACATLLNPSSAEPLVWPAPLKFISELNEEAKSLLEQALMEANREREKNILKGTTYSLPSPSHSDSGLDDSIFEMTAAQLVPYKGENKVICIPMVVAAEAILQPSATPVSFPQKNNIV